MVAIKDVPISIMPHYPLPGLCREKGGDLNLQNSNVPPIRHAS